MLESFHLLEELAVKSIAIGVVCRHLFDHISQQIETRVGRFRARRPHFLLSIQLVSGVSKLRCLKTQDRFIIATVFEESDV